LPKEVILIVFLHLENTRDVPRAAMVCKKWQQVAADRKVWERLDLSRVRGKKAVILDLTVQLYSVRHLTMKRCVIPDDVVAPLARRIPLLRSLNLSHSLSEKADLMDVLLQCCTSLEHLTVSNCPFITDSAVQTIANRCPKLQSLKLSRCRKISDQALSHLNLLSELRTLSLKKCSGLSEAGIRELLKGVPKLQQLDVRGVRLSASIGASLKRVSKVKVDEFDADDEFHSNTDSANPLFTK